MYNVTVFVHTCICTLISWGCPSYEIPSPQPSWAGRNQDMMSYSSHRNNGFGELNHIRAKIDTLSIKSPLYKYSLAHRAFRLQVDQLPPPWGTPSSTGHVPACNRHCQTHSRVEITAGQWLISVQIPKWPTKLRSRAGQIVDNQNPIKTCFVCCKYYF